MSLQRDRWIRQMAQQHGMIEPFAERSDGNGIISYGLSSYGYDVRVSREFKVFTNVYNSIVDPKDFRDDAFVDIKGDVCVVPPNSFALARTVEYFRIPEDVLTICVGKSTYARCGIIVNVTPFEPGWQGTVTLEISNTTPLPAKIYGPPWARTSSRLPGTAPHPLRSPRVRSGGPLRAELRGPCARANSCRRRRR